MLVSISVFQRLNGLTVSRKLWVLNTYGIFFTKNRFSSDLKKNLTRFLEFEKGMVEFLFHRRNCFILFTLRKGNITKTFCSDKKLSKLQIWLSTCILGTVIQYSIISNKYFVLIQLIFYRRISFSYTTYQLANEIQVADLLKDSQFMYLEWHLWLQDMLDIDHHDQVVFSNISK